MSDSAISCTFSRIEARSVEQHSCHLPADVEMNSGCRSAIRPPNLIDGCEPVNPDGGEASSTLVLPPVSSGYERAACVGEGWRGES
jgi:hypothetical protein